jgi:ribonuclease HI
VDAKVEGKGWRKASGEKVINEVEFKRLDKLIGNIKIEWSYVSAAEGVQEHEEADVMA